MDKRLQSVGFFTDPLTLRAVKTISDSSDVVLFVGAGVSIDQGLPTWPQLVSSLLRSEIAALGVTDRTTAAAIADYVVDSFFQIPSAAIVDGLFLNAANSDRNLAVKNRNRAIHGLLYDASRRLTTPSLAQKVMMAAVELRARTPATNVTIVTTNYDDILERTCETDPALDRRLRSLGLTVRPKWGNDDSADSDDVIVIKHVHGFLPQTWDDSSDPSLTFSEEDYFRWDERSIFRNELLRKFATSTVLMVGTSLRDHNIERALSLGQAENLTKWALLPIHDQVANLAPSLEPHWPVISDLIAERGHELRTTILQPDFYGQVYQFFNEIASAARHGKAYVGYDNRLSAWKAEWHVPENYDDSSRHEISLRARELADSLQTSIAGIERAKIEIWVRGPGDHRTLQLWCSSQGMWLEGDRYWPREVDINHSDEFAAIRCFSERAAVTGLLKYGDRSRWTHYVATPVLATSDDVTELPVGVVMLMVHAAERYRGESELPSLKSRLELVAKPLNDFALEILVK